MVKIFAYEIATEDGHLPEFYVGRVTGHWGEIVGVHLRCLGQDGEDVFVNIYYKNGSRSPLQSPSLELELHESIERNDEIS